MLVSANFSLLQGNKVKYFVLKSPGNSTNIRVCRSVRDDGDSNINRVTSYFLANSRAPYGSLSETNAACMQTSLDFNLFSISVDTLLNVTVLHYYIKNSSKNRSGWTSYESRVFLTIG